MFPGRVGIRCRDVIDKRGVAWQVSSPLSDHSTWLGLYPLEWNDRGLLSSCNLCNLNRDSEALWISMHCLHWVVLPFILIYLIVSWMPPSVNPGFAIDAIECFKQDTPTMAL